MTERERIVLRDLAKHQLEIAHGEVNQRRIAEWYRHNDCEPGSRPMIHIEIDTFQDEVITPRLVCESPEARSLEFALYHQFTNLELFDDDKVVPDYFPVGIGGYFHPFGHEISRVTATDAHGHNLGHQFQHVIHDLEDDAELLGPSTFGVDKAGALEHLRLAQDTFGDILPARLVGRCLYATPTQHIVHLMGMETMFFSMYDYPDEFKTMMDRLADDTIAYFKLMEREGCILPTVSFETLCQGSKCFTHTLPQEGVLTTEQVWGYMDSQESTGLSPAMYEEFIFPCYEKIAKIMGRLSYGCCEAVDPIWDCVSRLHGLRKVSISPWCNEEVMGERLAGTDIIYLRKPSPNYLGVEETLEEDAFRAHIAKTVAAAKGCHLEIAQRDVYTVHNNPAKVRRYVEIIREETAKLQ